MLYFDRSEPGPRDPRIPRLILSLIALSWQNMLQKYKDTLVEDPELQSDIRSTIESCEIFLELLKEYPNYESENQEKVRKLLSFLKSALVNN